MTDLRDRMRIYDQAPAPDYWNEVELRASSRSTGTAAPARSTRSVLLLAAALLLALVVGGAALALSRLVDPAPGSSVTHLAYGLDGDIYLADADGQNPVRIADGEPAGENGELEACSTLGGEGPMWSPDGRHVAYRSQWSDDCEGIVHLSDAEGHPVASFPGTGWLISWSPDSTRVATWIELWETVGIYGIDGERQALLSAPPGCVGSGDHDPLWSPDGQSVVAAGCEMPIDGQTPRRLSPDDPRSRADWVYSPDGTRVAYKTYTENGSVRTASLVIAEADGTELQVLTYQSDWNDPASEIVYLDNIVWSPLGDRVAFRWMTTMIDADSPVGDELPVASELRVLDISSGDETTVAAEPGIGGPLAYSPEGDRILHSRDADGETGLWSITVDGSDAQLLVPGADWGDWQPQLRASDPTATPAALPSASASADPEPTATPEPSPSVVGGLPPGPLPVTKQIDGGVEVTVTIAAPLWDGEPNGGYLCWGDPANECAGPPDGAGLIAFNDREYYVYGDPCRSSSTRPETPATTADALVEALANQASREASTSEDITVDGYAGKRIILQMADDVDIGACDEGSFALFAVPGEERARFSQGPGQTEEVWAVDVDGLMVVLIGLYYADTPQNAIDELRAILASATFELP